MRARREGFIIVVVDARRIAMCHDGWLRRLYEERRANRELWEEFEEARPVREPEEAGEEAEVTLEHPEGEPVAAER